MGSEMCIRDSVVTWREAHKVLVRLEEADSNSRALVGAVGVTGMILGSAFMSPAQAALSEWRGAVATGHGAHFSDAALGQSNNLALLRRFDLDKCQGPIKAIV